MVVSKLSRGLRWRCRRCGGRGGAGGGKGEGATRLESVPTLELLACAHDLATLVELRKRPTRTGQPLNTTRNMHDLIAVQYLPSAHHGRFDDLICQQDITASVGPPQPSRRSPCPGCPALFVSCEAQSRCSMQVSGSPLRACEFETGPCEMLSITARRWDDDWPPPGSLKGCVRCNALGMLHLGAVDAKGTGKCTLYMERTAGMKQSCMCIVHARPPTPQRE